MCTCVHICMCIYTYMYIYCVFVHIYTYIMCIYLLCFCVCMYIYTYVRVCVNVCMVYVHVGRIKWKPQRLTSVVSAFFILIERGVHHLARLAEPELTCLHLPVLGFLFTQAGPAFMWKLESELRSLCLCNRHLQTESLPQAPKFFQY